MKKGFTLSETLITLCIIGIVAALCAPVISNLRPNEYKTKYMKAYNTLTNLVPEIIDDEDLYAITYSSEGKPNCMGLTCGNVPNVKPFNDSSSPFYVSVQNDVHKFAKIFASKINLRTDPDISANGGEATSFYSQDGVYWLFADIGSRSYDADNRSSDFYELVFIDLDPDKEDGADFYSADND